MSCGANRMRKLPEKVSRAAQLQFHVAQKQKSIGGDGIVA